MTFIDPDGTRHEVEAPVGDSVLDIAFRYGIDIEGACEGAMACSTCHVIVDPAWYGKLEEKCEDEEDMLDLAGVAVSAGSACSSGKVEPSHVLRALGAPDGIGGCAIRVSMGWATTEDEIERFLGAWRALYAGLTNRWKAGVSAAAG